MIRKNIRYLIRIAFVLLIVLSIHNISYGLTITIDAGHGGKDSGAINSSTNTYEKDINLKIAKYLKEYLEQYEDVNIVMTRDTDVFLEVYDRAIIGRNNNSDLFVSLHLNSSESTNVQGAEIYVTHNKCLDKYNKNTTELGKKILEEINKLGIINKGVKTRLITKDDTDIYSDGTIADYYGVIRYSMRGTRIDSGVLKPEGAVSANIQNGEGVPAILIEHCYINSSDFTYVDTEEEIKKIAEADGIGIAEYYNLKKKSENESGNTFKVKENNLIIQPDTTIEDIKLKYNDFEIISEVKEINTGIQVRAEATEYSIIKLGDCNGDGQITPSDYVKIKNHIMEVSQLEGVFKLAADVNEDAQITPSDYVKIKNHIMDVSAIKIKQEE